MQRRCYVQVAFTALREWRRVARPESGAWRVPREARVAKRQQLPGSSLQSMIVACDPCSSSAFPTSSEFPERQCRVP